MSTINESRADKFGFISGYDSIVTLSYGAEIAIYSTALETVWERCLDLLGIDDNDLNEDEYEFNGCGFINGYDENILAAAEDYEFNAGIIDNNRGLGVAFCGYGSREGNEDDGIDNCPTVVVYGASPEDYELIQKSVQGTPFKVIKEF